MNNRFVKPKSFGEILDLTFHLTKTKFKEFFLILLIFLGPLFLIQAFVQGISGISLLPEVGGGSNWFDEVFASLDDTGTSTSIATDLTIIFVSFLSVFLLPVAQAAIILAIQSIQKNKSYTIGSLIKQAFTRYGAILGSTILFGLIVFGLVFIPMVIIIFIGVFTSMVNPVLGVILSILLFLGLLVGAGYLITRWSFYFGIVVLGENYLGYSKSWELTKNRTWVLFGLYVVFSLILGSITYAVEIFFMLLLGNTIMLTIVSSIVSIFTTMIFSVGYAVMFLDQKLRNDADDLKMMIEDFQVVK